MARPRQSRVEAVVAALRPRRGDRGETAGAGLRFVHKDPFDRMLLAKALAEGLTLLSADAALIAWGPRTLALFRPLW